MEQNFLHGTLRSHLLEAAREDVLKWCAAPNVSIGRFPSDQYWLTIFNSTSRYEITENDARLFLVTFRLARTGTWNYAAVAKVIMDFRQPKYGVADPNNLIESLAKALQEADARNRSHISAASKIAVFSWPNLCIFIWDTMARRAARARRRIELENPGLLSQDDQVILRRGTASYPTYHSACTVHFALENQRQDFQTATAGLIDELRRREGPLSRSGNISDEFIARRLLDKLMFWEGQYLRTGELPDHIDCPPSP